MLANAQTLVTYISSVLSAAVGGRGPSLRSEGRLPGGSDAYGQKGHPEFSRKRDGLDTGWESWRRQSRMEGMV